MVFYIGKLFLDETYERAAILYARLFVWKYEGLGVWIGIAFIVTRNTQAFWIYNLIWLRRAKISRSDKN